MTKPSLSIICPTLNEERFLAKLLWSIRQQTYKDLEIIVVDSYSKDLTSRVAKLFDCTVVQTEGRVSKARNIGTELAKGDYILYLDADVVFQRTTWLDEFLALVEEKGAKCAWVPHSSVEYGSLLAVACAFTHLYYVLKNTYPSGYFIYVDTDIAKQVKFDETLNSGEAIDCACRVNKLCGIWQFPLPITTSMRRAIKYGYLSTAMKAVAWNDNECEIKKLDQSYPVGDFK